MRVLVALGGNAILQHKEKGTAEEQFRNARSACKHLVEIVQQGHKIVITHGNGPQVGDILLKDELASDTLPHMPLDVCGAESQGMIGYMIQRSMDDELKLAGLDVPVATILTQTVVDEDDPAMKNPNKPIGPFYTATDASRLREERGWVIVEDSGRGYRRVVPSPVPKTIVEGQLVAKLFDLGVVVIAAGGGGVPVTLSKDGSMRGVEAVIDKDLGAAVLASVIKADLLLILTDVDAVFLNYGTPNKKALERMSLSEARGYIQQGQFAPGSMLPKIEAAVQFLEAGGQRVVITSLELARDALEGKAGTAITR